MATVTWNHIIMHYKENLLYKKKKTMTILIDYDPGQSSEWEIMKFWYLTS